MEEDLGGFKSQIKLSTLPRKLVNIHCQPRQTWFKEELLLRIAVMSARCIMKMLFTPYSFAQPCKLYGDLRQIGTIARFRRSSFTDIFELIFAGNKDPNLIAAMLWTIWNRRNNLRLGKLAIPLGQVIALLKIESWRQALAMLVFSDPDNSLEGTDPTCL